jgi:hypothetical protein
LQILVAKAGEEAAGPFQSNWRGSSASHANGRNGSPTPRRRVPPPVECQAIGISVFV